MKFLTALIAIIVLTVSVGTIYAQTPGESTVPGMPIDLVAEYGDTQVTLTWTAPDNGGSVITGYKVEYRDDASSTWTDSDSVDTTTAIVTGGGG